MELENRVFNSISVVTAFYLLAMCAFNLYLGQLTLTVILCGSILLLVYYYYLARFKENYQPGMYMFGFITYPILAANFYLNDGIDGPSSYIFLMIHVVLLSLFNRKTSAFWIVYNFLIYTSLFYLDNYYPEFIPDNYENKQILFIDHVLTYFASLIVMFAIISSFKKSYRSQKEKVEAQSLELIKTNHALRRSNDQKDKVIALTSHDLKNPLMSITQILHLIKNGELSQEETQTALDELLTMTSNTQKMLDNILEWATFELQNKATHFTKTDVKLALESTLNVYQTLSNQKGILLKVEFLDHPVIKTDVDRLLLIVRNLLQNAIKFTPSGGLIHFTTQQEKENTHIIIKDSGIGIPREKLKKIFELDIQTTYGTEKEKGTGLGLYLCIENAEKIGAALSVDSEEGKGSTFILTLPNAPHLKNGKAPAQKAKAKVSDFSQ